MLYTISKLPTDLLYWDVLQKMTWPSYRYWHRLLLTWVMLSSLVRMHSVTQVAVGYLVFSV